MELPGKRTFQADQRARVKTLHAVCVRNSEGAVMASRGNGEETKSEVRRWKWERSGHVGPCRQLQGFVLYSLRVKDL